MQLNHDGSAATYQITRYEADCVTVNDQNYTTSLLIMPEYLSDWHVRDIRNLQEADLLALVELQPDVILLGTGISLIFPEDALLDVLRSRKIGVEVMNTAAACRTYTVLIAEGRKVLAGLVIK